MRQSFPISRVHLLLPLTLILWASAAGTRALAQADTPPDEAAMDLETDSLTYPFLNLDENALGNATALIPFFRQLRKLEADSLRQVRIVHIGDSHLQADLFTGLLRGLLQDRFGAAGRGLVFPYPLARTNGPLDLGFYSPTAWIARKSIFQKDGPPLGLCGLSIQSHTPQAEIRVFLKERYNYKQDFAFDRITVFHEENKPFIPFSTGQISQNDPRPTKINLHPQPHLHITRPGDTLYGLSRKYGCTVTELMRWNELPDSKIGVNQKLVVHYQIPDPPPNISPAPAVVSEEEISAFHTRFSLEQPIRELTLFNDQADGPTTIYGLLLENSRRSGILYHVIGVNGVTYHHYNMADHFWDQLPALAPDLIIVSLGTNEAVASGFRETDFRAQVDAFVDKARKWLPGIPILLSSNPDVLRRKRYDNPNNLKVRQVILETAARHNLAYWDLYSIMGGTGSIRKWRQEGLAHTDYVHFSKEGYWLQAQLFFKALMEAYDAGN